MQLKLLVAFVATAAIVCLLLPTESALAATKPLIVLDPGHSGSSLTTIDPATQIRDEEYLNVPETQYMWDVAMILKAKLEAAGYAVLLTKPSAMATLSKRVKVSVANDNHAALGVSLHTSGHSFGNYGQIYVQKMDSYRENIYGQRVFFGLPDIAALSQKYGQIFLTERRKIEGSSVVITVNTSWGARGLAPGNVPIMSLFAEVPWVFCEAGAVSTQATKEGYAQSVFNSIKACIPVDGVVNPPPPVVYSTRYDQTDLTVRSGAWLDFTQQSAYEGSYARSATGGASATIRFNGTRLDYIGMKGTTLGIVDIYLDGVKKATFKLAAAIATYQVKIWSTGNLTSGPHTVRIVRNNTSAAGTFITLDAVDVWGTIAR